LSKLLGKSLKQISYAGLKDRQAITTQWLSVHCPGEDIANSSSLAGQGWRVIESTRHIKKLKTGAIAGNQFGIMLRDIERCDALDYKIKYIKQHGVPNYFGPQRFGHQGQNILKSQRFLIEGQRVKDRFLRGLYYSTARSFLFNHILSKRIATGNWNQALAGDVLQLAGTHSIFSIENPDEAMITRINQHDLSPASVLYGIGRDRASLDALLIQQEALKNLQAWCVALEQHGLEKGYRANILLPLNLSWAWQPEGLAVSFELPAGAYATSVLREMVAIAT
jgi:tRNA pseudouridine13 synthase